MDVLRTSATTEHVISSVDSWVPDPTTSYAVGGPNGFVKKIDLSTFSVTESVATISGSTAPRFSTFDGTNWWFIEFTATRYLTCVDFSIPSIIHRVDITAKLAAITFVCVISGNIYIVGKLGSDWKLVQYDTAGNFISSTTISGLGTAGTSSFLQWSSYGNYIWVHDSSIGGNVYKITTGAAVTTISVTSYICNFIGLDSTETNLNVQHYTALGQYYWGYIPLSGTTFTQVSAIGTGTPPSARPHYGILYDLDFNNFLGFLQRTNKVQGSEDSYPGTYSGTYTASSTYIRQPSANNFLAFGNGGIVEFSFVSDNNPITITGVWQETASTAITVGPSNSSIHNFQFTGIENKPLTFTVDSAVDPSASWTGFNPGSVTYISIHDDTTEEQIAGGEGKTLNWTVPSDGSYFVRVQLSPAHTLTVGTFELGYKGPDTLVIDPIILPNSCNHEVYPTQTFTASGGVPPYTWSHVGSTIGTGLSFNDSTQEFSGTPEASDVGNVRLSLTDSADGVVTNNDFPYTIYPTQTIATTDPMPDGVNGDPYSEFLATAATSGSAGDGGSPATWAITAGALPGGLSLDTSTGEVYGTIATAPGNYTFTIEATNIFGCVDQS